MGEYKTYLGNCLLMSIYFWFIIPNSSIVCYYNTEFKLLSFYVKVNNEYCIKFKVCKNKPYYCRLLFHVYPTYKKL